MEIRHQFAVMNVTSTDRKTDRAAFLIYGRVNLTCPTTAFSPAHKTVIDRGVRTRNAQEDLAMARPLRNI